MTTALVAHRGARFVDRETLDLIPAPQPTATWFPLAHGTVLQRVLDTLSNAGFMPRRTQLALASDNARFFGVIDLETSIVPGVALSVGVRNANDRSMPIAFCGGNRVFVCDNLAFSSEIVVARKHTRFGEQRFAEAICRAVQSLGAFQAAEARRIEAFQETSITDQLAESVILRSFEQDLVPVRTLPKLIQEWREPTYADFRPRTLWSLENAFTTVLANQGRTNPQKFSATTIALQGLLAKAADLEPTPLAMAV